MNLSSVVMVAVGQPNTATIVILDNDDAPQTSKQ